jgi:glycerol kinase
MEIWQIAPSDVIKARSEGWAYGQEIAAVGVTNQRETTVVWNKKTGKPYYNAIVWQDTRTDKLMRRARRQRRARIASAIRSACRWRPTSPAPRFAGCSTTCPACQGCGRRGDAVFGNIDTWVIWNLTGGPDGGGAHVTDVTNASRTMLMNLKTLEWDEEILDIMGVPRAMLPKAIRPPAAVYGTPRPTARSAAASPSPATWATSRRPRSARPASPRRGQEHLRHRLLHDHQHRHGDRPVEARSADDDLCYKFGDAPAVYALEGSIAITGALVQWLRDNLRFFDSAAHRGLATQVEDNGGVYFVPAFLRPVRTLLEVSDARGVIVGLTRYVNKGHIARAALEATAYQTREVLDAMNARTPASN